MLFVELASAFEALEQTSSRKQLVAILASVLEKAQSDEIDKVVYLCEGRVAPPFEPIEIGMGEKLVAEAIARAFATSRSGVLARFASLGDLGLVAQELSTARAPDHVAVTLSVTQVFHRLREIAETFGPGSIETKVNAMAGLLLRCDTISAKHLARLPLGRLRLGIGDPTVVDALSYVRTGSTRARKAIEEAYNKTSDLGEIARVFSAGGIEALSAIRVRVGKPIRPALAERLPSAEAIIAKLGQCAVEYKYDGFRCQIHKQGHQVWVFSRNLENLTAMFPEIVRGTIEQLMVHEAIVEGEALSYNPDSEEFYPFQQTTRRRRKREIEAAAEALPLRVFLFDLLYVDGVETTSCPYTARRDRMHSILASGGVLAASDYRIVDSAADLESHLHEAIARGLEGLMVKKLEAPYQAGARNFNWVKLKRTASAELHDTVDCVILGYFFGRGKRAVFGVGALLAGVYDLTGDEFVTISRVATGLSDEQWREVHRRCDRIAVKEKPARVRSLLKPDVWVEPNIVVEILADEITRSPVHTAGRGDGAGYALRFPRIVRFRELDRRPEQATTVDEIVQMYQMQGRKRTG